MGTRSVASAVLAPLLLVAVLATSVPAAEPDAGVPAPATPSAVELSLEGSTDRDTSADSANDYFDFTTFAKHRLTLQVLGGAYFSPVHIGPRTQPRFNLAPIDVRLGCMLYDPAPDHSVWRGTVEAIVGLTAAPVIKGFGDIVLGPSALLRGNFVQPDWKVVPYLQGGAGLVYTDAYRDPTQRAIGQAGEFYLTASVGLHTLLNPHLSLDVEGGYLHISNADMASRNGGVNALGGSLGMTYYFGPCGR